MNCGSPSQRGNPAGDPEKNKGPAHANSRRTGHPEPRIPSGDGFLGNSGRVAGDRLGSEKWDLGSVGESPSRGVPGKMRKASGVSLLYQNRRGKTPPRFRRFAVTPLRRDFPVAGPEDGKKAGD